MFDLVYRSRVALGNIKDIITVTIVQEERSKHFHLWLFPRYEWKNKMFDSTLTSVREIMKVARNEHKTEENVKEILATVELIKRVVQNDTNSMVL